MKKYRFLVGVGFVWAALAAPVRAQAGPGTVKGIWKISQTRGGHTPVLDNDDQLGRSVAVLGDLDGNGVVDLASSGLGDDDGGLDQGAAYVFFLDALGRVERTQKISELEGGFTGNLDPGDQFGRSLTGIGDLDGDGIPDLAVGANYDDDGGMNRGAVWLLCLNRDGTVRRTSKISSLAGGFTGPLKNNDEFGRALAPLGDLDGNGVPDLAVSAPTDSTGGTRRGAVWILFLRADGSVLGHTKIATGLGGFTGRLQSLDWFGFSLANLGDFDGDGVVDLAVGAALDDDGGVNAGAVWLLYLRRDGTVKDQRKISMLSGGFQGPLESPDQFGTSVARVGDLNGDGIPDLAVGAVKDGDGGKQRGAVYVLFLTRQGTVAAQQKISALEGNLPARQLDNADWFGSSLAPLGDLDGDGIFDLVVGARNDDDGGPNRGALYLTYLRGVPADSEDFRAGASGRGLLAAADPGPDPDRPVRSWTALARGPEPDGSLQLLEVEENAGGERLHFRLPVPESLRGREALVRLGLASHARTDVERIERSGLWLEPSAFLGSVSALAGSSKSEVELVVSLPAFLALEPLFFQAAWSEGSERELTDALELERVPGKRTDSPLPH